MMPELYGKIQEAKEGGFNFIMKELELYKKLQLGLKYREKVELTLVRMLASTQEKIMNYKNVILFQN